MATSENRRASGSTGEVDVVAIWSFLWWHKLLIIAATLFGGILAGVAALLMTPVYRAEIVVTPVRQRSVMNASSLTSQLGGLASLAGLNLGGLGDGETQDSRAILNSRQLVEAFIERNDILPALAKDTVDMTLWKGVEQFRRGVIRIREDTLKGTTTITVDWPDAETCAKWANGFAALANELVRDRALESSKRNVAYLNDQIEKTTVVDLKHVMYNLVESEMQKLMLANAQTEYAFAIVDPAVTPEVPVKPRPTIMVGLGVMLGFLLGIAAAFCRRVFFREEPLPGAS